MAPKLLAMPQHPVLFQPGKVQKGHWQIKQRFGKDFSDGLWYKGMLWKCDKANDHSCDTEVCSRFSESFSLSHIYIFCRYKGSETLNQLSTFCVFVLSSGTCLHTIENLHFQQNPCVLHSASANGKFSYTFVDQPDSLKI